MGEIGWAATTVNTRFEWPYGEEATQSLRLAVKRGCSQSVGDAGCSLP